MTHLSEPLPAPISRELMTPAIVTIRAATDTDRICLAGYCSSLTRLTAAISMAIRQSGGAIVLKTCEMHGTDRHLVIELKLKALSRLEAMRAAVYSAGGIIETVSSGFPKRV